MKKDIIIWIMYLLIYINEILGGGYELVIVPLILVVGYYLITKNIKDTVMYLFGIIGLMLIMWLLPILTLLYIVIVIGMKNKFKFINYIILFLILHIALLMGTVGEGINNLLAMNLISVNGLIIISTITMIHINKEMIKKAKERDRSILNFTILAIIIIIYIILNLIYLIPGNKVEISDIEDFNNIKYNSEVEINKDIDFQNRELEINTLLPFGGSINGNGKEISNIKDEDVIVGRINSLGNINNLKIVNSTFKNVVGINYGEVDKIRVENSKITGNKEVGVVGSNNGTISRVSMDDKTKVTGDSKVGGIAGINTGSVKDSYNAGIVKGNKETGGIVGENKGEIINTYYTGLVEVEKNKEKGAEYIGNIVGKQIKNELSVEQLGREKDVFYDPVYYRIAGSKENMRYAYSYDDMVGQPQEATQSYLKYSDAIDERINVLLKNNSKITSEEIQKEIKTYLENLKKENIKDSEILNNSIQASNKWHISGNSYTDTVYTEAEYNLIDSGKTIASKETNSSETAFGIFEIVGKSLLKAEIDKTSTNSVPVDAYNKDVTQEYVYSNSFLKEHNFNEKIWNLNKLTPGSSEPIKFLNN